MFRIVFVIGTAFGLLFGTPAATAAGEKEALAAIEKLGGEPVHVGLDATQPVFKVEFSGKPKFSDDDLKKAVPHLKELPDLRELQLGFTKVTDKGLAHLKDLKHLKGLGLAGTAVTDKGLEQLKGLTELESLNLMATKVTDAGVADLKKAIPKVEVFTKAVGK